MKNTIRRFVTAALAASMLTLTANAYTIPEYSFDYEQYHAGCEYCDFCSDTLRAPDFEDSEIAPSAILIVLKCEYSYFNSAWTIEDFPELQDIGVEITEIHNMENKYDYTDEEIQERLDEISALGNTYHTGLAVKISEEDQTVENARKVRNAIVEACENGAHPEFWAVDFNIYIYECDDPTPLQSADVNFDSEINALDATIVARFCVGAYQLDSVQQGYADVNADGNVNAMDATLIARYALGAIDKYGNVVA